MISTYFQHSQKFIDNNLSFCGKSESFWKIYNREIPNVPLRDTVLKSINNQDNLLGEGLSKKGYSITGIKDYIIRVYKNAFKKEDLDQKFVKPEKDYLNILEGVVLSIPGKIDIVKKKTGIALGVEKYAERIQIKNFPPIRNVYVSREETLKSLDIYENLKDFPLKSYKQAYLQLKKFCQYPGFQFDIISPNNILVDAKSKTINLIDPVTPSVNEPVHGSDVDFSKYHGCDSLYPILCDFIMQKEHIDNLSVDEKNRWNNAINIIISKCITAGKMAGLERNIEQLKFLYKKIADFWGSDELCKRYERFLNSYLSAINYPNTIDTALDYRNKEEDRINAIKQLDFISFDAVKPIFEQILEAKHQPKVEFPEIINTVLDKISEYGKDAVSILPALEMLFDKEIFYPTKKRLYNLFIRLQPENKKFISEMEKSAFNIFEKVLYKQELEDLYKQSGKNNDLIKTIYQNSMDGKTVPQYIVDKLWISRTCMHSGNIQIVALNNMEKAYKYICSLQNHIPVTADLVDLHKIILANIPGEEFIAGRLRTPDTDELVKEIFHIKKDTKKTVNEYSSSKDVVTHLNKLEEYIKTNYDKMDVFSLAANIFLGVIKIHPFINGNGRAARLFTEQFMLSKGYQLLRWPEETLYRKICSASQLAECLRENSR